jgi:hypothetical protein
MTFIQTSLDKQVALIAKASEVVANKVTSRSAVTSDTKYPSEKLFFDTVDNLLNSKITITSPSPGDYFLQGETRNIAFTSVGIDYVKISYSTDSGSTWHVLTASFKNDGTPYAWIIPSIIASNVLIKIENVDKAYEYSITYCNIDTLTIATSPIADTQLVGDVCDSYFVWGTNHLADSLVYWGLASDAVTNALPKVTTPVLYHEIIAALSRVQTTIYFYVVSATTYGASVTSGVLSFFSTLGGFRPINLSETYFQKISGGTTCNVLSDSVTSTITAS